MTRAILRANALVVSGFLALIVLIGATTYYYSAELRNSMAQVAHTQESMRTIHALALSLVQAETGQRGYLLTGRDAYLAPYHENVGRVALLEGKLLQFTADTPAQQARAQHLAPVIQDKLNELAQTVELRSRYGHDAALQIVDSDLGFQLMQEIQGGLEEMLRSEDELLHQRLAETHQALAVSNEVSAAGSVLALLLTATGGLLLNRAFREQRRAQEEARLAAQRLRSSFESLSHGIAVFDIAFGLVSWNECFIDLLGLPAMMLFTGQRYDLLAERLTGEDGVPLLERCQDILHSRSRPEAIVYERIHGDRILEFRRTPLPDGGFVLSCTDMTERAKSESVLREAQKMQAIGQLTGGIAHDFNNLLTVVLGNLDSARGRAGAGTPLLARIDNAIRAAERGASLTRHLLAFARRQPLEPKPVNLTRFFSEMTALLQRTLGEHIDIRVIETSGLWNVLADPAQVESAVLNLALNARDAMPEGGRLTIETANAVLDGTYARAHSEVAAGDYVMIAVTDTGTGMSPEVMSRVFEPFFTTKEAGKGTGLGLSMVFGFVKQSGGHVKIYSELGHGTSVKIYLPRVVSASAYERSLAPLDAPHGSGTILVVEDDDQVREVVVAQLREFGYDTFAAAEGREALALLETVERLDLLLTDVVLTGDMGGRAVAEAARARRPDLPVVYMSGYTENSIVHHGKLDDGVQLLSKPFKREDLARKVAQALKSTMVGDKGAVVKLPPRRH